MRYDVLKNANSVGWQTEGGWRLFEVAMSIDGQCPRPAPGVTVAFDEKTGHWTTTNMEPPAFQSLKVWRVNYESSLGFGRHVIASNLDLALVLARTHAKLTGFDNQVSEVVLVDGHAISAGSIHELKKNPPPEKGAPEPG